MQQTYYQVLITMRDIRPQIWRRLLVPAGITFYRFHKIIQAAFDWQDYHLFSFHFGDKEVRIPDDELPWDLPQLHAKRVKIDSLLSERPQFAYQYDFGDDWQHDIVVEGSITREVTRPVAICLSGVGCRPPEDVGGVYGYDQFLQVIADPKNAEYEEMLFWAEKDTGVESMIQSTSTCRKSTAPWRRCADVQITVFGMHPLHNAEQLDAQGLTQGYFTGYYSRDYDRFRSFTEFTLSVRSVQIWHF